MMDSREDALAIVTGLIDQVADGKIRGRRRMVEYLNESVKLMATTEYLIGGLALKVQHCPDADHFMEVLRFHDLVLQELNQAREYREIHDET